MKEFSDIEIIDCLRRRESFVVKYLSDKYLPVIRLMVLQGGGSSEDASDVFQDGLIIMLEKIDDQSFVLNCRFRTYLYSVCENLWKTLLDKRKAAANYVSSHIEHDSQTDITDMLDSELHHEILRDVFAQMDESSREVLNLYWQDVPLQDIAVRLGFTYGYIRKKKLEAQNELIARFRKHPGYINIMKSEKIAREIVK